MRALLGSDVGAYWNEAVHGCSAGFGSGAPALSEHHVVGTGKNMRFHLEGQFEGPPWDLTTNNHSSEGGMGTLYLSAVVTGGHNWKAGNFWRPGKEDLVGFSQISWTSSGGTDVIDITGFDGFYQPKGGFGQRAIRVGEHIAVTVTNPRTGQSVNATFDAPVASAF